MLSYYNALTHLLVECLTLYTSSVLLQVFFLQPIQVSPFLILLPRAVCKPPVRALVLALTNCG